MDKKKKQSRRGGGPGGVGAVSRDGLARRGVSNRGGGLEWERVPATSGLTLNSSC